MKEGFTTDEEYGYKIFLNNDRGFPAGHVVPGVTAGMTDVELLQKIFDSYIDESNEDSVDEFSTYKLDFSTNLLDTLVLIYKKKYDTINSLLIELDKQETDIAHKITRPVIMGLQLTDKEKLEIYDSQEELYIKRRHMKDALLIFSVLLEHAEKCRNYVLGMNKRKFVPVSAKYSNREDFKITSVLDRLHNNTTAK